MAEVRSCLVILILFVTLNNVTPKPIFGDLICYFMCDYDDDSTTSTEDYDFCGCNPRPGRRTTTTTLAPPLSPGSNPSMQFIIPPGQGVNATLTQANGSFLLNLIPWPGQNGAQAPAAPAAPTAAPPATAAPGATTAAAAEATTAATTATTAATTAAAAK